MNKLCEVSVKYKYQNTLIYGFGPYKQFHSNVTTGIIQEIRRTRLAKTLIFETKFSRKLFEEGFRQHHPQVILGLGQAHRAKIIRIERKAINQRSGSKNSDMPITRNGPMYRYVNLKLPVCEMSNVTYDAGSYVCNFSMYIACEYAQKAGARFAFLHLPLGINPKNGVAYLRKILRQI